MPALKADTDYVFIIRLWREPGSGKTARSWRGHVYHRGRRRHFV